LYSYAKEFNNAVEYTNQYSLLDFNSFVDKRYFASEESLRLLAQAVNKKLDEIPQNKYSPGMRSVGIAHSIIANCGPFHYFVKATIDNIFNCHTYLTLGYISFGKEQYFHKITRNDLVESFKTGIFPDHHIWLTLDSGEILDLTFGLTYRYINTLKEFENDLKQGLPLYPIAKHPDELIENMQYHPIAIEKDILDKAGYNLEALVKLLY